MNDLDALAEEFLERHRRGEWPQISEYLERYPQLAADIREVFPPLIALERAAQTGPGSDTTRIGPYRLLRLLGRGGQGEVHLAEDTRLGRQVALKVLPPSADPARFKREAAITARLDHPGICTVYEAGEDRGTAYIAMRYVEGESLADRLASDAGASSSATRDGCVQFVAMAEKVARALDVAHGAGLIHRDIKPGNIMLAPDGEPVILDFGLARDIADDEPALTHTGVTLGTPIYMSPEQIMAQRQRVDHRTDVYSLGVTLYECLTGRRPFDAATWDQLYNQILSVEPDDPRRLNPVIPKDLRVVLATAMDKDRDRRYQTAAAFADDLRNVRELQPIHAKPAGPLLRARRWAQRNPVLATSVAALFVALAAGLIITAVLLGDARAERDAKTRALTKANGLSLAAQSLAIVERDPGLALGLAVEAAARVPGPQANDALLRALAKNRELARFEAGFDIRPFRRSLAFRDDGRILFCAGTNHALWDLERGAPADPQGRNSSAIAMSPDGNWLVRRGRRALLDDLRRPGAHQPLSTGDLFHSPGVRASFSADSSLVAVDGDVWRVADAQFVGRFEGKVVFAPAGHDFIAWNHAQVVRGPAQTAVYAAKDGAIVAACWGRAFVEAADGIRVVDLATGVTLKKLPRTKEAIEVAWTDAAGHALLAVMEDTTCRLWSADAGKARATFTLDACFPDPALFLRRTNSMGWMDAVFSAAGDRVALFSGWYRTAVLFDIATGERYARLRGHESGIETAAFHPRGDKLATYSVDGTIRLWNAGRAMPVVRMRVIGERFDSIEFGRDGRTVLGVVSDGKLNVWDRMTGRLLRRMGAGLDRAHHAGRYVCGFATVGAHPNNHGAIRLWDAESGAPVAPPGALAEPFDAFALSDDRTRLATVWKGRVRVIAIEDGRIVQEFAVAGSDHNSALALDANGRTVAVHETWGTTVIGDESGRITRIPAPDGHEAARITPDGRFFVAIDELTVRVWEIASGREVAAFRGHRNWIPSMDIGPNGRYVATASIDGTVRVMDLRTRKTLYALSPGVGELNTARISPTGNHLLVVTFDGAALLYELATGDLVVRLHRDEGRKTVKAYIEPGFLLGDFTPDGSHVVTTSWDGSVRVWPVAPLATANARTLAPHERARYLDPLREDYDALHEAQRLIDTLRYELLIKQDVVDRIRNDSELREEVRAHALRLAGEGELDAWILEGPAWRILKTPGLPQERYVFADRLVREMKRLGERKLVAKAAAAADVRLGRYERGAQALAAMDRTSDETAMAFYAIALVRLGRIDEARKEIEGYLAYMEDSEDGLELKAEVEALLPR